MIVYQAGWFIVDKTFECSEESLDDYLQGLLVTNLQQPARTERLAWIQYWKMRCVTSRSDKRLLKSTRKAVFMIMRTEFEIQDPEEEYEKLKKLRTSKKTKGQVPPEQ